MRVRVLKWLVLCLLLVAAVAWLVWHQSVRRGAEVALAHRTVATSFHSSSTAPALLAATNGAAGGVMAETNRLAWRLTNTRKTIGQLVHDRRAILLDNALIDTANPLTLSIPAHLKAAGDPGAYIVQSRGPITAAFRAMLARAGGQVISYIPNNAYLVRMGAGGASGLAAQPQVQAVVSYEPYYKISSAMPVTVGAKSVASLAPVNTNRPAGASLLELAVKQAPLPAGTCLTLGLFSDGAAATVAQIEKLGGVILARDTSPFGPVVRVQPPANWTALAILPGVQIVEPLHPRVQANDLSRVTVGIAADTLTSTNYMNLYGSNVIVEVNDTGIDTNHPDFTTGGSAASGPGVAPIRIIGGDSPLSLVDTNGHGTHVAGIIAGNGAMSLKPVNVGTVAEGSVSNADFRGKAPLATLLSMSLNDSDRQLQETAALTNALISNNSWSYGGDNAYDLAAANYDAATRDALPQVTGSQPVLFVFAAGNDGHIGQNGGNGDNNGGSVTADTITSPGTAKNVITVAALEQTRNITNSVTNLDGSVGTPWQPETDKGYQVAFYSSRGNVGVGIEGATGRLKPDVAAPGSFVVSTRSAQWATNAYYNPTNHDDNTYSGQVVGGNGGLNYYSIFVPQTAVSVSIQIVPNTSSPNPFPTNLLIYVSQFNFPDPTDPTTYDFVTSNNEVLIPPDGVPDGPTYLTTIQGTGFNFAVVNSNAQAVGYNLVTDVASTNDLGTYYQVLEGMNDSLGGYYRYESGTSMAAADVSGTLALMEDFFVNHSALTNPSPALLKAMLINGARPTLPSYNVQVHNPVNNEGWGLINLPASLPPAIQTNFNGGTAAPSSIFLQDQSPTNALATGDSHTFTLTVSTNAAALPLRLTLAWTDPPGDPIAAIKLVNRLRLVVTNFDVPTNPVVYYGNDISANGFNTAENPTNAVSADAINNVQNIIIPQPLGSNYTVTVFGGAVNVNAVSAQTNLYAGPPNGAGAYAPNVVQDYALVISSGEGEAPNAFTVTDNGIVSNPTGDQNITIVTTTNTPLFNQFVGANSPVLNTNTVGFTSNTAFGGNAVDTLGTTNQWHFYVVTNNLICTNAAFTNLAFIIFSPPTLSIPRMGVFAGSVTNATLPEANIDLYVSTDPTLMNLNPVAISNCINQVDVSPLIVNNASLGRGGAKFIVFSNSACGAVYYIGVKSEDQMASEYTFLPVISAVPFSQMNNGNEILNGVPLPSGIPGGTPSVPGFVDVVAIGVQPIQIGSVVVTNTIQQTVVGDLVSSLALEGSGVAPVILMNHNSPNTPGTFTFIYDDSANPIAGSQPSAGPGSLQDFVGQNTSSGVWVFHVANSVAPFNGSVEGFSLLVRPQVPLTSGVTNVIPPHSWAYDFVDVPAGATNLTINATNVTQNPPGPDLVNPPLMALKLGSPPTLTDADKGPVALTNGTPPGNSLSVGPTDVPPIQPGRYWVGITNQSDFTQDVFVVAVILPPNPSGATTDFASTGATSILDDAVTYSDIFVTNTLPIASLSVGIVVQHPRISDLVFHLISPDGTRVLLMENRGGTDTNGAGVSVVVTNVTAVGMLTVTNSLAGAAVGDYGKGNQVAGWTVGTNQVSLVNDSLNAYQGNNLLALASGSLSTIIPTVPGQTYSVTVPYRGPGIAGWWRGENNASDSIGANNGTAMGGITYPNGEVGKTFSLNGTSSYVSIPDSPLLDSFTSRITLEAWVKVNSFAGAGWDCILAKGNSSWELRRNSNGSTAAFTLCGLNAANDLGGSKNINDGQWHHVVGTYDGTYLSLFVDGTLDVAPATGTIAQNSWPAYIGGNAETQGKLPGYFWNGWIDETSIYNRALSASEIKAIFAKGTAGKYDPSLISTLPAQSLAEAQFSATGQSTATINGSNTTWQTYTATFKAVTNQTTVTLAGLEPGMLLGPMLLTDPVLVTNVTTNVYYLTFTENTNLTTTPIKFAPPPFVPSTITTNLLTDGFEQTLAGDYAAVQTFGNGWTVLTNQVSVVTDPVTAYEGSNFLALASGAVFTNLPTMAGNTYTLTFAYRGPGIAALWRGESNVLDSINGNNGTVPGTTTNTTTVWFNGFEGGSADNTISAGGYLADGWLVDFGSVDWLNSGPPFNSPPYEGNWYIDLDGSAAGGISTNIVTVPGMTYTLGFAYAPNPFPGATPSPQAEVLIDGKPLATVTANFANSPANLNWQTTSFVFTATLPSTSLAFHSLDPSSSIGGVYLDAVSLTTNVVNSPLAYTNGEVNEAFQFDGSSSSIVVPASTSLAVSNVTLEAWVFPTTLNQRLPVIDYGGAGQLSAIFLWLNTTGGSSVNPGGFFGIERNASGGGLEVDEPNPVVTLDQWNHVAFTVNTGTLTGVLYCNGVPVMTNTTTPPLVPASFEDVNLGYRNSASAEGFGSAGLHFLGDLDEVSIYNRPLSASEIKAIYQKGSAGKFDPASAFAQNLAEAQVSLGTQAPITISGNNTNWQVETITFTATQNGTPLQITGLEPGMLLDDFTLTQVPGNLYYLPEESLDAFIGKGAFGDWQLEIQDDRAGAGLTNVLVSWELQFVFANTNAVPAVLSGGIGQSNQFLPAGDIAWYQINVPANANYATNLLLFASAPVNVWFDTNNPPATNIFLFGGPNGSQMLSVTNPPDGNVQTPNIYAGQTYYLGVQNTANVTINYGIEVDFDHGNGPGSGLPAITRVSVSGGKVAMQWTASASAQFEVQWSDDLTQPWNTDTNVITSSTGNFSFTDDGTQTAPLGPTRFYRLVQIAP